MRTLLVGLVLLFSCYDINAQVYNMPDLSKVAAHFFEQLPLSSSAFYSLGFERRPEGYYVVYKANAIEVSDRILFYDAADLISPYQSIDVFAEHFPSGDQPQVAGAESIAQSYLRQLGAYTVDAFDRQPYYGYEGWYEDAAAYFEQKEELTDDELHALARAYSVAAGSLLNDDRGYSLESERFELPMGQNALSDMQVIAYRERAERCLAAYRDLKNRNPDYETPIGAIGVKYANEVVYFFLNLLYYQDATTALDIMEENIYPAHLLREARNLLNSCPKDAVLLTFGDNDTYPLYYLQAMGSLRKDVVIANLSLLQLPRYRLMLLNAPLWSEPLKTRLPENQFTEKVAVWAKQSTTPDTLAMETIYTQLSQPDKYYQQLFVLSSTAISLPVPVATTTLIANSPPSELTWQAGGKKPYIYPGEVFIADALTANDWQRPLCFAHTVPAAVLSPWQYNLAREGLVYRLYPEQFARVTDWQKCAINVDYSLDFWLRKMAFDTTTVLTSIDQFSFYDHNIVNAAVLAGRLSQLDRNSDAVQLCRLLIEKHPNHIRPWNGNWLPIITVLINSGEKQLAQMVTDTTMQNLRNGIIHTNNEDARNVVAVRLQQFRFEQGW